MTDTPPVAPHAPSPEETLRKENDALKAENAQLRSTITDLQFQVSIWQPAALAASKALGSIKLVPAQ